MPVLRLSVWGFGGGHWFLLAGAALVATGLYVSSLCASGLRALIVSFPVVALGGSLVGTLVTGTNGYLWRWLGVQPRLNEMFRTGFTADESRTFGMALWVSELLAVALALAIVGVLLWLACWNHHIARGDGPVPRRQVAGLMVAVVAASCAAGAVWPVLLALWLVR